MYTLTKQFKFAANRQLFGFPIDHPCSHPQEIDYTVIFNLSSINLNKHGYIIDYNAFYPIENFILSELQGKTLNNVFQFNPTPENMAKFFFKRFKKQCHYISAVTILENNISARYILSHDEEDHIEIETQNEKHKNNIKQYLKEKKDIKNK